MELFHPWYDTYLHNWKLEELGIIASNIINVLMTTYVEDSHFPLPFQIIG